jgi:hypothetical protein
MMPAFSAKHRFLGEQTYLTERLFDCTIDAKMKEFDIK